jgi:hypothetical protein
MLHWLITIVIIGGAVALIGIVLWFARLDENDEHRIGRIGERHRLFAGLYSFSRVQQNSIEMEGYYG